MAKQQRALERISGDELELLRTFPYESPGVVDGRHAKAWRAAARSLLVAGLLEKSADGEVRCTERGAEQAAPLTVAEVGRIMRPLRRAGTHAEEIELDVATRIAAEVAHDDPDIDVPSVAAAFFRLRRSRVRVLA